MKEIYGNGFHLDIVGIAVTIFVKEDTYYV
jgi:hypothetical protein